jgi:hypothetical protein
MPFKKRNDSQVWQGRAHDNTSHPLSGESEMSLYKNPLVLSRDFHACVKEVKLAS